MRSRTSSPRRTLKRPRWRLRACHRRHRPGAHQGGDDRLGEALRVAVDHRRRRRRPDRRRHESRSPTSPEHPGSSARQGTLAAAQGLRFHREAKKKFGVRGGLLERSAALSGRRRRPVPQARRAERPELCRLRLIGLRHRHLLACWPPGKCSGSWPAGRCGADQGRAQAKAGPLLPPPGNGPPALSRSGPGSCRPAWPRTSPRRHAC
jgi:hypothetical protein